MSTRVPKRLYKGSARVLNGFFKVYKGSTRVLKQFYKGSRRVV